MINQLSWQQLHAIEQEQGDAFYLVDLDEFRANFHGLRDAFRAHYANTELAYSYKTNYLPRLCRLVDDWGGYAEVVSRMEYEMALLAGVDPRRIVVNGPYKTRDDLAKALSAGSLVNLDAFYQVDLMEGLGGFDAPVRVGVRCNFDVGDQRISRFGFDAEDSGVLRRIVQRLRALRNVDVVGIHFHYPLPGRRPAGYAGVARRMIELASLLFPEKGPRVIDIGGGYFSRMPPEMAEQFGGSIPTYADYAAAIGPVIAEAFPNGGPQLVLEPGVGIVATTASLVTRVLDVQPVRGNWFAQVSSSIQTVRPTMARVNLPVRIVRQPARIPNVVDAPVDVVGYTCMESDVLHRGLRGDIAAGDYLVFGNCGAYTNVQKMPFIRAAPAMLTIDPAGRVAEVLRRAERTEDVLATYAR
jgi:diaminopimelate decarboxylase